jgi:D-sedoheptulose 7-phosphate isomerase
MKHEEYIQRYFDQAKTVIDGMECGAIDAVIEALFECWKDDRWVYTMGNGGSASTASHFAADLAKTVNDKTGARAIKAVCLGDNYPLVSAAINDRGWNTLYEETLATYYVRGGIGVGFSVHGGSGKDRAGLWSQNLLRGLQYIKDRGGLTIGFSGFDGGAMKDLCDISVVVPVNQTSLVESFHVTLHHLIAFRLKELIENYQEREGSRFV